jgi:hypothetical protein
MKDLIIVISIIIGLAVLVAMIATIPTWLLWNLIMVSVFEFPKLTFLQTYGLFVLLSLIFNIFSTIRSVK